VPSYLCRLPRGCSLALKGAISIDFMKADGSAFQMGVQYNAAGANGILGGSTGGTRPIRAQILSLARMP
jgi:hypothetical protein